MIISLSGLKRSGKDCCADILVNKFKFKKISFAEPLRSLCSKVFEIPVETFLSDELKEKDFVYPLILTEAHLGHFLTVLEDDFNCPLYGYQVESLHNFIGFQFKHPRHILQIVGTDMVRDCINDQFWMIQAKKRITETDGNVVIPDCRFPNEIDLVKSLGGLTCLIKRPSLQSKDLHVSEQHMNDESLFRVVISNDGTLSQYLINVNDYFSEILKEK